MKLIKFKTEECAGIYDDYNNGGGGGKCNGRAFSKGRNRGKGTSHMQETSGVQSGCGVGMGICSCGGNGIGGDRGGGMDDKLIKQYEINSI